MCIYTSDEYVKHETQGHKHYTVICIYIIYIYIYLVFLYMAGTLGRSIDLLSPPWYGLTSISIVLLLGCL